VTAAGLGREPAAPAGKARQVPELVHELLDLVVQLVDVGAVLHGERVMAARVWAAEKVTNTSLVPSEYDPRREGTDLCGRLRDAAGRAHARDQQAPAAGRQPADGLLPAAP